MKLFSFTILVLVSAAITSSVIAAPLYYAGDLSRRDRPAGVSQASTSVKAAPAQLDEEYGNRRCVIRNGIRGPGCNLLRRKPVSLVNDVKAARAQLDEEYGNRRCVIRNGIRGPGCNLLRRKPGSLVNDDAGKKVGLNFASNMVTARTFMLDGSAASDALDAKGSRDLQADAKPARPPPREGEGGQGGRLWPGKPNPPSENRQSGRSQAIVGATQAHFGRRRSQDSLTSDTGSPVHEPQGQRDFNVKLQDRDYHSYPPPLSSTPEPTPPCFSDCGR